MGVIGRNGCCDEGYEVWTDASYGLRSRFFYFTRWRSDPMGKCIGSAEQVAQRCEYGRRRCVGLAA